VELNDLFDVDEGWPPKQDQAVTKVAEPLPVTDGDIAKEFREDFLDWLVNGKTEPPRAPGLHCSSLWKTCPRLPLLEAKYAEYIKVEPESAGQRMTYDVGHALHDLIQNSYMGPFGRMWGKWKCLSCQKITHEGTMPQACPECDAAWRNEEDGIQNIVYAELFVADDVLKYCGHCDGILLTRAKKKVVFEFKTISKSQYGGLKQPKHEHVVQVHAYMNALGLKEAIILYLDKGSQADWRKMSDGRWSCKNPHLKVFLVKFDDDLWASMSKRITDYHRAEKRAKALPTVEIENINEFARVCSHKGCDMAGECHLRDLCFAI
jgi:hypothetical protein